MCMQKEHNHVLCCVFSDGKAVMNRNAENEEGLEEVTAGAENNVRKLKSKALTVCSIYDKSHYVQTSNVLFFLNEFSTVLCKRLELSLISCNFWKFFGLSES